MGLDGPRREAVEIKRAGFQPSGEWPADRFTGMVRIDPLFDPPEPACVAGALVTFGRGARVGRKRRCAQATCSGSSRARSIGMAPRPPRP